MTEEITPPELPVENQEEETQPEINFEQIAISLNDKLKQYQFFSDQVKFNATLFEGFNILLEKITKIEQKLDGNQK